MLCIDIHVLHTNTHTHIQIHTHIYKYTHTYTNTHTHIQIHTHIYNYTHTYINTQTSFQVPYIKVCVCFFRSDKLKVPKATHYTEKPECECVSVFIFS